MASRRLILYDLFKRLREEAGLELDTNQYLDFLRIFQSGIINPDRASDLQALRSELRSLCKIHWLTHPRRFGAAFDRLFDEEFDKLVYFNAGSPEREVTPSGPPQNRNDKEQEEAAVPPKEQETISPPAPPPIPAESSPGAPTELFLRFKQAPGKGKNAGQQNESTQLLDNNFLFSDKHLPASERRLQQHWRYLGALTRSVPDSEINMAATVAHFAEKGYLSQPVYDRRKSYHLHTVFLIDDGGSMSAFADLADHLVSTIRTGLEKGQLSVYYFHNDPNGPLYRLRNRSRLVEQDAFIREAVQTASLLIIISDGGAARGMVHDERIEKTRDFLLEIRKKIPRLLWLNPVPKERWAASSAIYIALFVKMLEADEQGLRRLPQILRHL